MPVLSRFCNCLWHLTCPSVITKFESAKHSTGEPNFTIPMSCSEAGQVGPNNSECNNLCCFVIKQCQKWQVTGLIPVLNMLQDVVRDKIISVIFSSKLIWNCRTKHLGIILLLQNMISHQILKRLWVQRNEDISNLSNVNKILVQWCVHNSTSQIVRKQTLLKFCGC